jgi:hypothetical protein
MLLSTSPHQHNLLLKLLQPWRRSQCGTSKSCKYKCNMSWHEQLPWPLASWYKGYFTNHLSMSLILRLNKIQHRQGQRTQRRIVLHSPAWFWPQVVQLIDIFNLLKPICYVMHQQVLHSTTVRSAHTAFKWFVFIWEQTATCASYIINWMVFITETKSVYCAVRTESLNKAVFHSSLTL